ncbi:MAG: sulfurtransferase TusA family protein [Nitriliruptoraceae bacterium]
MPEVTRTLDASGLACPMPVVRARQAIDQIESGQVLEVISTDRGSLSDIPAWAEGTGNRLVEQREEDSRFVFLIEKG